MQLLPTKPKISALEAQAVGFAPVRIVEVELEQPLPHLSIINEKSGHSYQQVLCVVRLHTRPIGVVKLQLEADGANAEQYAEHIWSTLGAQINEHLLQDGLASVTRLDTAGLPCFGMPRCIYEREQFLTQAPFVSVIVPTHNRFERVRACLHSLLALHYPRFEVIIVDNAPSTTVTADYIQQTYRDMPQVRYVREDRPGPSWARNCGIQAAKGEILAFVDDDVIVDPYWLAELVRGFSLVDDVVCVTGLVLPLELETPAQVWFEEYGGFSKGFTQRIFDMREYRPKLPLYPYTVGLFGTGASMAFTSAFLHNVKGFDPTLGNSRLVPGSEDTAMFFQVVMRGHRLVYTPAAPVYHPHHRDYTSLQKQIYRYGAGLTAFLMKSVLENPPLLFDLFSKVPYGLYFILSPRSSKNKNKTTTYPKGLTMLELKGMLCGPLAYIQSRWAIRDADKTLASVAAHITLPVTTDALVSHYDTPMSEQEEYSCQSE